MKMVAFNGLTGQAITSRTGKVTGVVVNLGTLSAKEIREAGRGMGLKGGALTKYVNQALSDDTANRAAFGAVAISALQSAGYVFDTAKARTGTACVSFVKQKAVKAVEPTESEMCAKLGITVEQLAAMKALKS